MFAMCTAPPSAGDKNSDAPIPLEIKDVGHRHLSMY